MIPHGRKKAFFGDWPRLFFEKGGKVYELGHSFQQHQHHLQTNMKSAFSVGTVVRVLKLPEPRDMPADSQAAFVAALGCELEVAGHGPHGHLELDRELDSVPGGFMNSIWIEPEFVQTIG